MWRACRPPGIEFHITPLNWPFKSDFQSRMNIIAEFLHLTRGHNKGPKDPRGKSCLFSMPLRTSTKKNAYRFALCDLAGVFFSINNSGASDVDLHPFVFYILEEW